MKKTYIQPTIKLHNIGVRQMLCTSPEAPAVDDNTQYNGDGTNLSKEDDFFGW